MSNQLYREMESDLRNAGLKFRCGTWDGRHSVRIEYQQDGFRHILVREDDSLFEALEDIWLFARDEGLLKDDV